MVWLDDGPLPTLYNSLSDFMIWIEKTDAKIWKKRDKDNRGRNIAVPASAENCSVADYFVITLAISQTLLE